jgi:signal transduction histidine kinase/ActR/RegA family two-component response regulator
MSSADYARRFVHPDDMALVAKEISKAIGTTDPNFSSNLEHRIIYPDGEIGYITVRYFVVKDDFGRTIATYGVNQDISDRKKAEEALRSEREQLLSIFESINEVILVIDPKSYEILYANKFTEDLYGTKLQGGKCYEKLGGLDTACRHCSMDSVMELGGNPLQWEYHSRSFNRDFLATDRMIRWPNGRDVKFQIAIDITERKLADQEKDSLRSQLVQAQKMEAIGTLAGGIAHDFNNLLQVILGYSELILDEKIEGDPDRADLSKIHQAARSGADLVRNLLTFSRKTEPKPVPMSLNNQIRHVEKLLHRTIPRMIDIQLDLAEDLRRINADRGQIEQIIMNLAVNARDAMGEEGSLKIRTENVTLDEEYCELNVEAKPGDYVLLSVSDTGRGMDRETLQHIFEPFFTTKELGRGTGLGLAMVYGIVKQHGGNITCYSEVGLGTTFKIYLPPIEEQMERDLETSGEMPAFGTETVLIIDDEDLVRELGHRILARSGYKVLTAADGHEGLEVYRREKDSIALVILDLIMPTMGGKDCLQKILQESPQARVLIASGYSADASTNECIEMGAKGFVPKPFRFKELLRQVRKTLDQS